MPTELGAKERLRRFLEQHVGEVLSHDDLQPIGRVSSWPRRLRELREDEGMQILSHLDRADLRPGEYVLVSLERRSRDEHRVDPRVRARILERDGSTCQSCGATVGDLDPETGRGVRLHVDHIDPNGAAEDDNLRVLCSVCNEGRSNLSIPRSTINLLTVVRRASRREQIEVLTWLKGKFDP